MKSNKPKSKQAWLKQKLGKQHQQKKQKAGREAQNKSNQNPRTSPLAPHPYIFGRHAIEAAVRFQKRKVHEILTTHELTKPQQKLFQNTTVKHVEKKDLDQKFSGKTHQGWAAKVGDLPTHHIQDILDKNLILMLDQVTDPHNLGAILRSADAFGVAAILIPRANSAPITDVTTKTAAGAVETVPVIEANLAQALQTFKENGFWAIGLDGAATETLAEIPTYQKTVLVMGSEGEGLRPLVEKHCDHLAKLPMSGTVESLNVSVATGIALYQIKQNIT